MVKTGTLPKNSIFLEASPFDFHTMMRICRVAIEKKVPRPLIEIEDGGRLKPNLPRMEDT